jgi:shikimate kinase / 3-dehydroquinate synthase
MINQSKKLQANSDISTQHIQFHNPSGNYEVLVGEGLLDRLGILLAGGGWTGSAVLVADETVARLYTSTVLRALEASGIEVTLVTLPAGEIHKNLDTVRWLYDRFQDAGLDRSSTVVVLGGGVVGDTTGFAAATYMRGISLVQVPTTLLAMVDSSIGGKVGVDLPRGKNLVGAFKQPALVVADIATLRSLPEADFAAGMAEVVKHGIIDDPDLFVHLETSGWEPLSWVLPRAIDVKRRVVEADPFEKGHRAVLNLGHTFGHALETLSNYQMRHGFAISIGLVLATHLSAKLGLCEPQLSVRLAALLDRLGLPIRYSGHSPEQVWAAMASDKKRQGNKLRFVLPQAIGNVIIHCEVQRDVVLEVLAEIRE